MRKYKIGMRIIKTSASVFLSIAVYLLLLLVDDLVGMDHTDFKSPSNIYTPFFAGIAAIYATHNHPKTSIKQAKIRSFGSIIGGYFGMIVIYFGEYFIYDLLKINNFILGKGLYFLLVSLCIIPLFKLTIMLKNTQATFITGLTYLSVTISIRNGGMDPFFFATNRVLSTIVGVGIALLVNNISLIHHKNKNILFVSSLDNNILNSEGKISDYLKYKLNILYTMDMKLSFVTTRTLSSLGDIFNNVNVNMPMVIMNGSAIYEFGTKTYSSLNFIDDNLRMLVDKLLDDHSLQGFSYTVNDNVMHSYHNKLINDGEIDFYNKRKNDNFISFVRGNVPSDIKISLYIIIDKKEKIDKLIKCANELELDKYLDFVTYDYEINGYSYLKINTVNARKELAIDKIKKQYNCDYLVVCGSGNTDIELLKSADVSICLSSAKEQVKTSAQIVLDSDSPDEIVKIFSKLYLSKNIKKTVNKYIKND